MTFITVFSTQTTTWDDCKLTTGSIESFVSLAKPILRGCNIMVRIDFCCCDLMYGLTGWRNWGLGLLGVYSGLGHRKRIQDCSTFHSWLGGLCTLGWLWCRLRCKRRGAPGWVGHPKRWSRYCSGLARCYRLKRF